MPSRRNTRGEKNPFVSQTSVATLESQANYAEKVRNLLFVAETMPGPYGNGPMYGIPFGTSYRNGGTNPYNDMSHVQLVAEYKKVFGKSTPVTDQTAPGVRSRLWEHSKKPDTWTRENVIPDIQDRDVRDIAVQMSIAGARTLSLSELREKLLLAVTADAQNRPDFWRLTDQRAIVGAESRKFLVAKPIDREKEAAQRSTKERLQGLARQSAGAAAACDSKSVYSQSQDAYSKQTTDLMRSACLNMPTQLGCMPVDGEMHPFTCTSTFDVWATGDVTKAKEARQILSTLNVDLKDEDRDVYNDLFPRVKPDGPLMIVRQGFRDVWGPESKFNFHQLSMLLFSFYLNRKDMDAQMKEDGGEAVTISQHYKMVEEIWNTVISPLIRAMVADPRQFEPLLPQIVHTYAKRYLAMDTAELLSSLYNYADSTDLAKEYMNEHPYDTDMLREAGLTGPVPSNAAANAVAFLAVKDAMLRALPL
jgi:hypothetical protein